jgi:hypothetical protein
MRLILSLAVVALVAACGGDDHGAGVDADTTSGDAATGTDTSVTTRPDTSAPADTANDDTRPHDTTSDAGDDTLDVGASDGADGAGDVGAGAPVLSFELGTSGLSGARGSVHVGALVGSASRLEWGAGLR